MSEWTPTSEQAAVIEHTEGILVVDAGPGTGKSSTITQRYARLIACEDIVPDDVLLVTFTSNAATAAKDRICTATSEANAASLRQAPIETFQSLCLEIIHSRGFDAPELMGLSQYITDSVEIIDDSVVEGDRFRTFYQLFLDRHPEHHLVAGVVSNPDTLLPLINQLAAKGVFPTASGWYRDGGSILAGDFESYRSMFDAANKPTMGSSGPTNSHLKMAMNEYGRERCFHPEAPTKSEIRGDPSEHSIPSHWAEKAFFEDRSALFDFVHDVYFEYVRFALRRNYINASFLQMFAFMLLCEDASVRDAFRFPYVIVDEFQETSELQFKLMLLLSRDGNICVAGDWKQSIYGFENASADNIRCFESRIVDFTEQLNDTVTRVGFPVDSITRLSLTTNFRSPQSIIDLAEDSLKHPTTKSDTPSDELSADVHSLESAVSNEHSQQRAVRATEQADAVIDIIQSIVGNESYGVRDEENEIRPPTYGDIAVLTRQPSFGREVHERAMEFETPASFTGSVELFRTKPGILVLAWLRVLAEPNNRRGWAVILEEAGYPLDQIRVILNARSYPSPFQQFVDRLRTINEHAARARSILDQYDRNGAYAEAIVRVIDNIQQQTHRNLPGIIRYIETCIDKAVTHDVNDTVPTDSITIQTIHGAKGLEYPIVILADVSEQVFPSTNNNRAPIRFDDPIGLRAVKHIETVDGNTYHFDSWRYQVLSAHRRGMCDEERRLLYVALTRARDHVIMTAGEHPSPFFEALPLTPKRVTPTPSITSLPSHAEKPLTVSIPDTNDPIHVTAHDLIDQRVFTSVEGGRDTVFGEKIHTFAEQLINGADPSTDESPDTRRLRRFLDSLAGNRIPEVPVTLPCEVNAVPVTITGTIDLLHDLDGKVQIIDYKTDTTKRAKAEYRKQLSVYYHAVDSVYDGEAIEVLLFFTADGECNEVLPLPWEELMTVVTERVTPVID